MGRVLVISKLYQEGIISDNDQIHLLGCALPQEFGYYNEFPFIESIDTSNPIFAALEKNIYSSNVLNEKPKLSYLVNSGIYIIKKKILKIVKKNRYLDMNDLINLVKKKKFKVGIYSLYEPVYDIGDLKRYKKVKKLFK